ncbi:MAG TPA: hypothetical protein VG722_03600 [Tepidisphaeraceae bacterium]|nr:hypothetical protein [Tepidisphaeraceae bacterium]
MTRNYSWRFASNCPRLSAEVADFARSLLAKTRDNTPRRELTEQ